MVGGRETTAAAGFLCRSLARIVRCLDDLEQEELHWRPAPAANSLLVIAAHALANAEENVLGVLGHQEIRRERRVEFDDAGATAQVICERWARLEQQLTEVLGQLPPHALTSDVYHPRRGLLSGFDVVIIALRHAAEHMGQADLTRDLLLTHRDQGGAVH